MEVAKEMNEKLNGTWIDQEEDSKLQEKYRLALENAVKKITIDTSKIPLINISISFLRR